MKEEFDDIEFKQLFQAKAHKAGENRWFTPRVLNRLPEKESANGILSAETWIYAISVILCAIGWVFLVKTGFFDVITVRSLIYIAALAVGSLLLLFQTLRSALTP